MLSINGLYAYDPTIFEFFYLPEQLQSEKQNIIDYILESCAELEIIYPDAGIMKNSIRIWSSRNLLRWEKLYNTMHFDYNPIWNKDGVFTESYEDHARTNQTGVRQTTGYNDDDFVDRDRDESDGSANTSGTRTRTERGNIGITSTQELIERERALWDFNIIETIANDFRKYYCLMVW